MMRRPFLLLAPFLLTFGLLTGALRFLETAGAQMVPPPGQDTSAVTQVISDRLLFQAHTGGVARTIAMDGDAGVAAFGSVLATLHLDAAGGVMRRGSLPLAGYATAVAWDQGYAYVGTEGAGLVVADVSDPTAPRLLSDVLLPALVQDVALYQELLLAALPDGIQLLDIANPAQPLGVSAVLTGTDVRGIAIENGSAYVVDGTGTLSVVDISVPLTPTVVGSVPVGPEAGGVAVAGGRAYVSWNACGGASCATHLSVVDITVPDMPQVVTSRLLGNGRAGPVTVASGYAYVTRRAADQGAGVDILDVSTPDFPVTVQTIVGEGAYGAWDVAVQGTTALVAYGGAGVRRFDVSDPTNPVPGGTSGGPALVRVVQSWPQGWLVGAGDGVGRGELWAVEPAGDATLLGAFSELRRVTGIGLTGSRAVVAGPASGGGRLLVLDWMTPTAPAVLGSWDGDVSGGIDVALNTVAAAGAAAVRLIDIAEPLTPTQVGTYPTTGAVAVNGTLLAVAAGPAGLELVSIADPAAPQLLGRFEAAWPAIDVALRGDVAVVAAGEQGVHVVDVTDPAAPQLLGSVALPGMASSVAVYGDFVLVPAGTDGAFLIDLSDPAAPAVAGRYADGRSYPTGAGRGDGIALGTQNDGIYLLAQRYAAAGRVVQANGLPWSGAAVTVTAGELATTSAGDGSYTFKNAPSGTYSISPAATGYVFTPAERIVTVPPNRSGLDFTILAPPRLFSVDAAGAKLVFTDTQGVTTTVRVPPGGVSEPILVPVTPTVAADSAGYRFAGQAFQLGTRALLFDRPVSLTISFTPADVGAIVDEELVLWWWNGSTWEPAGATCEPFQEGLVSGSRYHVAICQGGRFALFGPPRLWLLPTIITS